MCQEPGERAGSAEGRIAQRCKRGEAQKSQGWEGCK